MVLLDKLEIKVFKGRLVLQALPVLLVVQGQQDQMDQLDCQVIKARQVILVTKVLLGLWGQLAILEIKVLRDHKGNKDRIGSVTSTPLSLLPTSLCRLRSRHWAPSTVRVASSCWNLVV